VYEITRVLQNKEHDYDSTMRLEYWSSTFLTCQFLMEKLLEFYDNEVIGNNHINFATAINATPNGNTITLLPPDSGIILLAAKDVGIELIENWINEMAVR